MIDASFGIYLLFVGAGMALAFARLLIGPSIADRINAADILAICCVGLALGHGWWRGDGLWVDVAMVAGLVLFVGTTAVSVFIDPDALAADDVKAEP